MIAIVIGEFCEDMFVYGKVTRLSPEAPVPVFNPIRTEKNSGMVGNVYNNLKSLDKEAIVHIVRQVGTMRKTRYVDDKSNHMFMRVDEGEEFTTLSDKDFDVCNYDLVIVSDYNKGFLSDKHLIQIGKTCTGISILDSKRHLTEEVIDSFGFVKVNEDEYQRNKKVLDDHIHKVIITLGKNGVKFMNKIFPSPSPKETIDVSGAGDTFTASFALKYYETKDIFESINFANEMSAIVVSKRGVVTPI